MGDFSFELSPRYQKEREEKERDEAKAKNQDEGAGLSYEEYGDWLLEHGEIKDKCQQPEAGDPAGSDTLPTPESEGKP